MTILTDTDRRQIASTMRAILRYGCTMSYMPRDVLRLIRDNRLIEEVRWPGYHVKLTERGAEFLRETDGGE